MAHPRLCLSEYIKHSNPYWYTGPLGGTLLQIHGGGFGGQEGLVEVLVNQQLCLVHGISNTEIVCQSPSFQQAANASVQVCFVLMPISPEIYWCPEIY